jgi:dTMP kinase
MNKSGTGRLITVEGQDGAGKTTNIDFIEHLLREYGVEVLSTREPGGTGLGEKLRRLILDGHELHIHAMSELLMIFAARAQHLEESILPALSSGTWVLCDRFTDATFAYQSGGRGLPWGNVETLEHMVQGNLRPDLTVLLDVDPETGEQRTRRRDNTDQDRFESQQAVFKQNVRRAYLDLAHRDPGRVQVVDASLPLDDVRKQIRRIISRFLGKIGDAG